MYNLRVKRILSSSIDLVIMLGLFFLIGFIYSCSFIENNSLYQKNISEINEILLESGLFYDNGKNELVEISDRYDEKLIAFYSSSYDGEHTYPYVDTSDKYVSYNDAKEKSGLFNKVNEGIYIPLEGKTDEEFLAFYKKELKKAEISLYNYSNYHNLVKYINDINKIGGYLSIVLSNLLVYFIMPFILKQGRTIGDRICKLKLLSQDEKKPSFAQLIVRFIAWIMIVVFMSTWLLYIPFFLNIIICLIDKKSRGIPDLLAVTMLVEEK